MTNLLIITVILTPALVLFWMILFSGKPEDEAKKESGEDQSGKQ